MRIDISDLNTNPKRVRVYSTPTRKIHEVPTRRGTSTTRQFPSGPGFELIDTSGDNCVARQRALIGDP